MPKLLPNAEPYTSQRAGPNVRPVNANAYGAPQAAALAGPGRAITDLRRPAHIALGLAKNRAESAANGAAQSFELQLLREQQRIRAEVPLDEQTAAFESAAASLRSAYGGEFNKAGSGTWQRRSGIALQRARASHERALQADNLAARRQGIDGYAVTALETALADPERADSVREGFRVFLAGEAKERIIFKEGADLKMALWDRQLRVGAQTNADMKLAYDIHDDVMAIYDEGIAAGEDPSLPEMLAIVEQQADRQGFSAKARANAGSLVEHSIALKRQADNISDQKLRDEALEIIGNGGSIMDLPAGLDVKGLRAATAYLKELNTSESGQITTQLEVWDELFGMLTPRDPDDLMKKGIEDFKELYIHKYRYALNDKDWSFFKEIWDGLNARTGAGSQTLKLIGGPIAYLNGELDQDYPNLTKAQRRTVQMSFKDWVLDENVAGREVDVDMMRKRIKLIVAPITKNRALLPRTTKQPISSMVIKSKKHLEYIILHASNEMRERATAVATQELKDQGVANPKPTTKQVEEAILFMLTNGGAKMYEGWRGDLGR